MRLLLYGLTWTAFLVLVGCNDPEASRSGSAGGGPEGLAGAEGAPEPAVADWCAGHGIRESQCTLCNPSLIAGYRASGDWCGEHGFPESVCPQCNPQDTARGGCGPGCAG